MLELLRYAAVVLIGASSVVARPINQARQSTLTTTGATQGGVQPRLEINELIQDADQWNIYLLGLQAFMQMDPTDPMSYYQIAGIHGVPFVSWGGVQQCPTCNPQTGYCAHSSTLFPTWHRAYLGLFEQSLQANAIAIASQFTGSDQDRYVTAATSLRMPYWDWALPLAAGEAPFPDVFQQRTISVNTPTGQQSIANPLYAYSFGTNDHSFMNARNVPNLDVTVRNPTFTAQNRADLRSDLYTLLSNNQGWNAFSTQALTRSGGNFAPFSLESLHDRVHGQVGGDMGWIPTAGWDPIFWLHHAAVDRAFALYQAAYPSDWVESWEEKGSTYTWPPGTVQDGSSDLTPFFSNSGFWNSDDVRRTDALGYTYSDLTSGQSAASIINTLYGDNGVVTKRDGSDDRVVHEYVADITVNAMGVDGSFTVFFFDGPVNEPDPDSWDESKHLLGTHGFFTGPKHGDGSALANAGSSLTAGLRRAVKGGRLASMEYDDVKPYLKKNLRWRTRMLHGEAIDSDSIPGFDIVILSADVQMPSSKDELPVWSKYKKIDFDV